MVEEVVNIGSEKNLRDDLLTLQKYIKQLHMYPADQLRSALKTTIKIAMEAIEDNVTYEDSMSGVNREECLVIIAKNENLLDLPGDDMRLEISLGDEGLHVFKAKVCKDEASQGKTWGLQDISYFEKLDKRGEKRVPMSIEVEYCLSQDQGKGAPLEVGQLLNFSSTGLLLSTKKPLALGSEIMMMLDLNWGDLKVPMGVVGAVIREQKDVDKLYSKAYAYGYGVKFYSPRTADMKGLK